ncbi:MAG: class I SAM-dependent methyltransferase [Candidatus Krumholzibacteriia bacterium]
MRSATRPGLYDDPVVYDTLLAPGTARELAALWRVARWCTWPPARAPWLLTKRPSPTAPRWLEPACGTGRLLRLAAARGLRAVGFDRHPAMVAYAREAIARRGLGRRAHVFHADLTDFGDAVAPGSIDFAFCTLNTLRHLPSDAAMLAHLDQVARTLRPGAVYAVGLSLTRYGEELPDEDVWTARRGGLRVTQLASYLPPDAAAGRPRRERVISHLVVATARGGEEHRDDVYDLRCYDERQWAALLRRSPLRCLASFDADGRPLAGRILPYRIDVLGPPAP